MNLRKDHLHDKYIHFQTWILLWVHESRTAELYSWATGSGSILYATVTGCHVITSHKTYLEFFFVFSDFLILSQFSAMDASARVTMKDAAKCDKRREWQNSENQENAERILHFQVIPGSMSTSGR